MTLQQITYFLQLAEELHYWRTSYKVSLTQSALSRQIKALEDELQVQLFIRSNRKVELTPAGKFLQQQWQPLAAQLNASVRYARKIDQGEKGSVVIHHPGSASYDIIPDLLARIAESLPAVKAELVQLKHTHELELIKSFQIDLCYSRQRYTDDLVHTMLVRQDQLALAVPSGHCITSLEDITPASLQNEKFVLSTLTDGETYQMKMDQVFAAYGIVPDVCFESDFGSMILSLVEKGLGISVVPFAYALAQHPGVRLVGLPFEVPLYLHWRKDDDNPVVRNIIKLISENKPLIMK